MDFTLGGVDIQAGFPLDVTLLAVGLLVGYWGLVRRYGRLLAPAGSPPVTRRQVGYWVSGVALFWLADGWPMEAMSEHLFSFHMFQHLVQAFAIPPLLLLGLPEWMGDVLLRSDRLRRFVQVACRPLVAGVVFNLVFLVAHLPGVVNLQLQNELVHAAVHLSLIGSAAFMWGCVFSPFPTIVKPLQPLAQMFYLFLMTVLPMVPSAFLLFGDTPLYPVYATVSRPWNIGVIDDMRVGGLIMKLVGGFWLWGVIGVKYFRWAAANEREERAERADRLKRRQSPIIRQEGSA